MYTDLASVLTLIAALSAAIVTIINAAKARTAHKETTDTLEEIHKSTNGNLTKVTDKLDSIQVRLDASEKRATQLQEIITKLTTTTRQLPTER